MASLRNSPFIGMDAATAAPGSVSINSSQSSSSQSPSPSSSLLDANRSRISWRRSIASDWRARADIQYRHWGNSSSASFWAARARSINFIGCRITVWTDSLELSCESTLAIENSTSKLLISSSIDKPSWPNIAWSSAKAFPFASAFSGTVCSMGVALENLFGRAGRLSTSELSTILLNSACSSRSSRIRCKSASIFSSRSCSCFSSSRTRACRSSSIPATSSRRAPALSNPGRYRAASKNNPWAPRATSKASRGEEPDSSSACFKRLKPWLNNEAAMFAEPVLELSRISTNSPNAISDSAKSPCSSISLADENLASIGSSSPAQRL